MIRKVATYGHHWVEGKDEADIEQITRKHKITHPIGAELERFRIVECEEFLDYYKNNAARMRRSFRAAKVWSEKNGQLVGRPVCEVFDEMNKKAD